ncbi:MAG: LysM peptidoglycan-binding domain-containing protein [Saprospiraceae bacterium]|nr:LysM peptidoglycan-binding domain-containing protein [Saprospiraceae bacterium]
MTTRRYFLLLLYLLPISLLAQTGDRDHYLTFQDTIQIKEEKSRIYIQHEMAAGQTLYGLARFYGLELDELLYYNPNFKAVGPQIGDTLYVPVPRKVILPYWYPGYKRWKGAPLMYTVRKGETLFQISRRHFGIPLDSLLAYNRLKDTDIQPGTSLFVGWLSTKGIPDSTRTFFGHPLWEESYRMRTNYLRLRKVAREHEQQGFGSRIPAQVAGEELVVLHQSSEVNDVIALKNPLNNRIVFARVIGRIPPGTYPPGTILVASESVVRLLAVKDSRFFVRVKYLVR